jgi:3'-phosphoadenosine 5'-phosphosulfate (PAPS) 3'-phosphatase
MVLVEQELVTLPFFFSLSKIIAKMYIIFFLKLKNVTILRNKQSIYIFMFPGYKTLEVVKGNADAYLHTTKIKKWDLCAANAILSSVDGKMTTLSGDFIDYSSTTDKVVSDGLLVTVFNHFEYLKKLAGITKKKTT